MATIVPVSHLQRWRSRSRNQSYDTVLTAAVHTYIPVGGSGDEYDDDDEDFEDDAEFDDLQTSPWLVVPQGFVSPVKQRTFPAVLSASPPKLQRTQSWQKAMEMRRATAFY